MALVKTKEGHVVLEKKYTPVTKDDTSVPHSACSTGWKGVRILTRNNILWCVYIVINFFIWCVSGGK